jgi:hypothetical protein
MRAEAILMVAGQLAAGKEMISAREKKHEKGCKIPSAG